MSDQASEGGWLVEVMGSGSGRRRRYLVHNADRALAISTLLIELGNETHIMSVTRVPKAVLEISRVRLRHPAATHPAVAVRVFLRV